LAYSLIRLRQGFSIPQLLVNGFITQATSQDSLGFRNVNVNKNQADKYFRCAQYCLN
jgi:hypothetical protein